MINKETAKAIHTTVADQAAWYAIGFDFLKTSSTGEPQLLVTLDGSALRYGADYIVGAQGIRLAVAPEAGKSLIITRDVPFVQDIDFQMGIINPKKIEKGLDESVMRDQELRSNIVDLGTVTIEMQEEIEEVRSIAETADATAVSAETIARAASTTAAAADAKAQQAQDVANDAKQLANLSYNTARQAESQASGARATAESAFSVAGTAQRTADGAEVLARAAGSEASIAQRDVNNIARKIPANASETNKLATMADVQAGGKVQSVNGQQGVVVLTGEDIVATVDGQQDTIQGHIQTVSDEIDAVSQQVSGKQNKLVAGENITIDESTNTISATGGAGGTTVIIKDL